MKRSLITLLLVFSLFSSGCTGALLLGAGGTAGYFIAKDIENNKDKD